MKTIQLDNLTVMYYKTNEFREVCTNRLLKKIGETINTGFGKNKDPEDIKNHIFDSENIGIIYDNKHLLGFATTQNIPEYKVCYLHGVAVGCTAKGVGSKLIKLVLYESEMDLFGFTTQNPIMYSVVKNGTSTISPNPDTGATDEIFEIAKKITANRKGVLNSNMVITDLYDDCLYCKIPQHRNNYLWQWWQKMLSIDKKGGSRDGIVFIGKIK